MMVQRSPRGGVPELVIVGESDHRHGGDRLLLGKLKKGAGGNLADPGRFGLPRLPPSWEATDDTVPFARSLTLHRRTKTLPLAGGIRL